METQTNLPALPETFKPEVFKGLIDNAPGVYLENSNSVEKAVTYGNKLLAEIDQKGMSDEMDERLNKYLGRLKDTLSTMDQRRKPITTMFTAIAKLYTGLENMLDPKNPVTVYSRAQDQRNAWATKKAEAARQARLEQERKLNIEQAKINAKAHYETQLRSVFDNHVKAAKYKLLIAFESLTLENFSSESEKIKNYEPVYPFALFEKPVTVFTSQYLTKEDLSAILVTVKGGKFEACAAEFKTVMLDQKQYYVDRLATKYRELHQIHNDKLCEAEREQLRQEAEQRAKSEKEKLEKETEETAKAAQASIEAEKTALTANTLFDLQTPEVVSPAQVREGYEITVTHPSGWTLIFAKYFEKEGIKLPIEEMGKKTLDSMRKYCEKLAKDGEQIQSPYLKYKEVFKAVTKR